MRQNDNQANTFHVKFALLYLYNTLNIFHSLKIWWKLLGSNAFLGFGNAWSSKRAHRGSQETVNHILQCHINTPSRTGQCQKHYSPCMQEGLKFEMRSHRYRRWSFHSSRASICTAPRRRRGTINISTNIQHLGARLFVETYPGRPWQETLGIADLQPRSQLGVLQMVPKQQNQQHPGRAMRCVLPA